MWDPWKAQEPVRDESLLRPTCIVVFTASISELGARIAAGAPRREDGDGHAHQEKEQREHLHIKGGI